MSAHDPRGVHLIVELDDCGRAPGAEEMEVLLRSAAAAGHGTVIAVHAHVFGANGGVAGIVVLAESHASIHTWPEFRYAAADVFMCGAGSDPEAAARVLAEGLEAGAVRITRLDRAPRNAR